MFNFPDQHVTQFEFDNGITVSISALDGTCSSNRVTRHGTLARVSTVEVAIFAETYPDNERVEREMTGLLAYACGMGEDYHENASYLGWVPADKFACLLQLASTARIRVLTHEDGSVYTRCELQR